MKTKRLFAALLCLVLVITSIITPSVTTYAATGSVKFITLNVQSKLTMYTGSSKTIKVTGVSPKGSSIRVLYESSAPDVVKVTSKGTMKALKAGSATVTVTSATNKNVSQKIKVTVKNLVKNSTENKAVIPLDTKKTLKLSLIVKASNLSFRSGKKSVATVDSKGVVTAKKAGTDKITVKGVSGASKGTKQVITVYVAKKSVKSVSLNVSNKTLQVNNSFRLKTTVNPTSAANVVTYKSSKSSVATVNANGKVTAKKAGTARITATTVDGKKKAVCVVVVQKTTNLTETVTPTKTVTPTETAKPTKEITPTETAKPTKEVTPTETAVPTKKVTPTEAAKPTESVAAEIDDVGAFTKVPYISTYYFNPMPTTEEDINIPIYVTDSEQTEYIDLDDSKRFDVLYEVDGVEHYLNNVKAGDMTIPIGRLSAGAHYFAIQSIDKQTGLKSHKVYNDLTVLTPEESIISPEETYTVTEEDLTTYQINKNDSTDENDLQTTRDGLTQLFKDLSEKGYQKCILPMGTYRINGENKRYGCIMIPSNFTVDMNGSTFKLNTVLSNDVGSSIVSMDDAENAHLTNGTLEGDRFERKELGLETGYNGEPINTFLFRGCKNCSITNLTIKNTTGHTVGTQYVWGPGTKISEYTKTKIVNGEEIASDDCSTSNMIDLTKMKAWSDYVSVGQAEGYRGIKGKSGVIYVHFYDENQNYLETVTGYQFRKIRISEQAKYGRVTMLGTLTVEDNVSFHCKHLGDYLEISDIDFIDTRTTALAPSACNNLLIENCTYTRAGNSITPCAVDFEDGWQECQDVYYRNNKVLETSGTATVIDNTGFNHVYEGIEGHQMVLRRGVLGGVIRNVQDETGTIRWAVGNTVVCKYSRIYDVKSGNICISHSTTESGTFEEVKVRNCEIVGAGLNSSIDIVTYEDCVFTKLSGANYVLKNCVAQPQPYWGENTYCYNCEFKNLETPGGEISFSFNKFDAERVFENCKFTGKTGLKHHNYFNSGTFKGCEFEDLSINIGLGAKETCIGIDFVDCTIQSTADNFIYLGPYAYSRGYVDVNFNNCNITHTGENLIYSMGKATEESIIEFDNCTINKDSGKLVTGYGSLAAVTEASLDVIFKGGSVKQDLDTSWCAETDGIRIKYQ